MSNIEIKNTKEAIIDLTKQPYLTENEAAELSKCCKRVLQQARYDREISYYTRGKRILYKPEDVLDWNKRKLECVPAIIIPKSRRRK